MRKIILKTILMCIMSTTLNAQSFVTDSVSFSTNNVPITVSYYGNFLIDPGFKIGVERPFKIIQKTLLKKNGKKRINQHVFLNTVNLGYYYTAEHNHSFFLNTELGYRKVRKSGFKTETFLGLGYMRTFLTDETYKVEGDNVSIDKAAGSNYFMPSLSFGIGYDNSVKQEPFPFAISLRPNVFIRYPYNGAVLPQLTIELNFSYRFNAFSSKTKQIYKSKTR
ncbi:MAG: hypothetical protein RIF39_07095 [Cyclobacteriaceae bacterium]